MTSAAETIEYGFADPKESGHWRIYGDDFVTKLEASGFDVEKVDFVVPEKDAAKFGTSAEPFYLCRKRAAGCSKYLKKKLEMESFCGINDMNRCR